MFKNVLKNWWLDKPVALELHKWEEWDKEISSKHPVRFFLQEKLPELFHCHVKGPLNRWYWAIRHRTTNRYHIIKPRTLEPGWCDERTLILHGAFECLAQYWEHHNRVSVSWWPTEQDITKYDNEIVEAETEDDKDFLKAERDCLVDQKVHYDEAHDLIHWWTETRPMRDAFRNASDRPDSIPHSRLFNSEHRDDPDVVEYRKYLNKLNELDRQWEEEDQEMLMRLVKIRQSLWI